MCDNLYEKKQSINIHIVKEKQILIVPENCADNPSYSIENFIKRNLTELVFALDSSGSMQGLERDAVGGAITVSETSTSTLDRRICDRTQQIGTDFYLQTGKQNKSTASDTACG